ncbi:hypothetical protein B0H15DRAFT_796081 [Mycena belliarum]|uniref:Uncharacterized protein n=1 Tax=Mycena belliarum TaxID=1033014 RepID=A0AAD6XUU3_9AGAR|nr:hypothetical protein B0H15DRAFT_796081 [Mycena belliae]
MAAESLANPHLVTPLITHDSGILLTPQASKETILASVVSEYKKHDRAVSALEANHKLSVILDGQDQPVVFTIGSDNRFYCIRHAPGTGWERIDITPSGLSSHAKVLTFDVVQHHISTSQSKVAACVALKDDDSAAPYLFYAKPVTISGSTSFKISDLAFVKLQTKDISITSLTIIAPDTELTKPCRIIVGSAETDDKRGTDYNVDTDPNNSSPWTTISLPQSATAVLQVLGATRRSSIGASIVSLYKTALASPDSVREVSDVGTSISCLSLDGKTNTSILLDKIGDGARSVCATSTSKGLSDIYVAGLKGIGYYAAQKLGLEPDVYLHDISFKQVIASERGLNVSLLAVSISDELYYIHGVRKSTGVSPIFETSGTVFPIRQHVSIISTQYNASINATEVMLVDSAGELKHMLKDVGSGMWTQHEIHVPSLGMTTLGSTLLSSTEATYALVNDAPIRLSPTAGLFTTDISGNLCIVIQANSQLAAPTLTAVLKGSDRTFSVQVEPKQRLVHQWAQVQSGADLKNAKSTAGEPVFPHTGIPTAAFDACAELLGKVPSMIENAKPRTISSSGTTSKATHLSSLALEKKGASFVVSLAWAPWDVVTEAITSLGNLLEAVWHGIEHLAKVAIKIAAGVVDFFAEDTLNIDATRFIALFGFLWDYDNILKTQKIVVKSVKILGGRAAQIVKTNCSTLKGWLPKLQKELEKDLPPPNKTGLTDIMGTTKQELEKTFMWKLLEKILNNPIIREVQKYVSMWILRALSLFDDVIHFPGFGKLEETISNQFTGLIRKLEEHGSTNIASMIRDVFNTFLEVLKGTAAVSDLLTRVLSDAFWALFDAGQDIFELVFDLLADVISQGMDILSSPIKIPGISSFWTAFTKTPFSFVDVGSLALAQVLYLITMMWKGKLPFDLMLPWESSLSSDGLDIPLERFLVTGSHANAYFDQSHSYHMKASTTEDTPTEQHKLALMLSNHKGIGLGLSAEEIELTEQQQSQAGSLLPQSTPKSIANFQKLDVMFQLIGITCEAASFYSTTSQVYLKAPKAGPGLLSCASRYMMLQSMCSLSSSSQNLQLLHLCFMGLW